VGEGEPWRWYVSDWVDGSYAAHGKGRLWRLEIDLGAAAGWLGELELEAPGAAALLAAELRAGAGGRAEKELMALARGDDLFLAQAALGRLADEHAAGWTPERVAGWGAEERALAAVALALAGADAGEWVAPMLADEDPAVGVEMLRWIAGAVLVELRGEVDAFLGRSELGFDSYEAAMATWNTLAGVPERGVRDEGRLLERVRDRGSSARLRAYALRLLPEPESLAAEAGGPISRTRFPEGLDLGLLAGLLAEGEAELSLEVVRVLADHPRAGWQLLMELAADRARSAGLRAEAVAGLATVTDQRATALLVELAGSGERALREEALRGLRYRELDGGQREELLALAARHGESADLFEALLEPASLVRGRPGADDGAAWEERLAAVGAELDREAGGRIFHHARVALCANCHRHEGRGKVVGPDLSAAGERGDRAWLLESILQPSLAVGPEYLTRAVVLKDGRVAVGIRLRSWLREQLRDAAGHTLSFDLEEVESIHELGGSLMPEGLAYSLTDRELRDLLAFLEGR